SAPTTEGSTPTSTATWRRRFTYVSASGARGAQYAAEPRSSRRGGMLGQQPRVAPRRSWSDAANLAVRRRSGGKLGYVYLHSPRGGLRALRAIEHRRLSLL